MKRKEGYRYGQLAIATIILMFLGIAYAWSLFIGAIKKEYPDWSAVSLSMVFTVQMIGFCTASFLAESIVTKLGRKLLFFLCGVVYLIGMTGASFANMSIQLCIFYGAMCGFSTGVVYNTIISILVEQFGKKSGTASGIMMMGYGMGGLLLGSIVSQLHQLVGWRVTFRIFGIFYFTLMIVCIPLLTKNVQNLTYSDEKKEELLTKYTEGRFGNIPLKKAIRTKAMLFYYFWGVNIAMLGLGVIGHIAQTATEVYHSASFAVMAAGVLSVSNGVSRILFGILYDTKGRKFTMRLIDSCMVISIVLFVFSLTGKISGSLIVAAIFLGMGYGGSVPCNSSYARECFGDKYFSGNFGFMASDGLVSAFIGPTILSVAVTATGHYLVAYLALLVCCVLLWIMEAGITKSTKMLV